MGSYRSGCVWVDDGFGVRGQGLLTYLNVVQWNLSKMVTV